jgi:hypothetical protein
MPEWLYEAGIGENRAALVEGDIILEAAIELPGDLRAGTVVEGRLATILIPGKRGIVLLPDGSEALIEPIAGVTEGGRIRVEIVREAVPERGRPKLAKARQTDAAPQPGPSLEERLRTSAIPVTMLPHHGPDRLEAAGWSELLEEAATARSPFRRRTAHEA